jgi:hypothetical protein
MDIKDIVNYLCKLDITQYTYEGLSRYRNYLALYFAGNRAIIGKKIYINAKIVDNQYVMNLDYYLTKIEKIKIPANVDFYFKFVNIAFPWGSTHSTLLILDNKENKAYYIDPNGYPEWYVPAYFAISDYLGSHAHEYNLSLQLQKCMTGPQAISQDEYCANWTLLLLYLRLNTSKSIDEIINTLTEYDMVTLNKIINNWTCYLWSIVIDLQLIDIIKYLNDLIDLMPIDRYRALSDFVDNMINKHMSDIALNTLAFEYKRYSKT